MQTVQSVLRITLGLTLALTLGLPASGPAQINQQPLQAEGRLDAIVAHTAGVEAGFGLSVPAGIYMRTGLVAGIGAGRHGLEGRTDLISRFSLDPFRQSHWAPYGGAGISGRYRSRLDGGSRAYLLVLIGVEGPLPLGGQADKRGSRRRASSGTGLIFRLRRTAPSDFAGR